MPNPIDRATQGRDDLTVDTGAAIFGCDPLFDVCTNDALMSLSFAGASPFLDWIGWQGTDVCILIQAFLNFVRPDKQLNGTCSVGYLADPCADANSFEADYCDFKIEDFARLRRASPVRDVTKIGMRYCEKQPRYRLDGSMITDQMEYDMRLAMEVLLQDFKRMVIDGNAATPGQFSGLEQLVKTGYTNVNGSLCEMMDSIVIDWNDNPISGGAGITWNGNAASATHSLIDYLLAAIRQVRQRISMAPALASQRLSVGDIILMLPYGFTQCILDAYTCWSVCDSNITINSLEARKFRDNLLGGMFGAGRIFLDGFEIPIMPFDYNIINSGQTFDAYLLTGQIGNVKTLYGQYNNLAIAQTKSPEFKSIDGGKILTWTASDNTCILQNVEMQPRLVMPAPWAQVRIQDIVCTTPSGSVISSDPCNAYFPY